jgi:hypothetical protein
MIEDTDEIPDELFSMMMYHKMRREYLKLHESPREAKIIIEAWKLIPRYCRLCFYRVFMLMKERGKPSELSYLILYKILTFLMTKLEDVDYLSYDSYVIEALVTKHTQYDEENKGCEYYTEKVHEFREELSQYLLKELFSEKYYPDPQFMWEIYTENTFETLLLNRRKDLKFAYLILMIAINFLETKRNDPDYIAFDKIITNKEESIECFYNRHKEKIHEFGEDMNKFFMKRLNPFNQQSVELLRAATEKAKDNFDLMC